MTGHPGDRIGSLRDLARDVAPGRDLWPAIEARLLADAQDTPGPSRVQPRSRWAQGNMLRVLGAAAVIATLAVGIWIGRSVLPRAAGTPAVEMSAGTGGSEPESLHAAYQLDARYTHDRAALARTLDARLASLPPDSRAKVVASLATLHDSMRNLETALGHDPTNALLQELLVNTYQDEMRVLTAVNEAGSAGEGI
jgi:hypothetical protein